MRYPCLFVLMVAATTTLPACSGSSGGADAQQAGGARTVSGGTSGSLGLGGTGGVGTNSGSSEQAGASGTAATALSWNHGLPNDPGDHTLEFAGSCKPEDVSIQFTPPSTTFTGSTAVLLSVSSASEEVRYTTDGSLPKADSTLFAGKAIALDRTTRIRARRFSNGTPISAGASAVYVARDFEPPRDLPVIVLDSYAHGSLNPGSREFVDVAFIQLDRAGGMPPGTPRIATRAAFHIRGQSSAEYPKMPLRIELRESDESGRDCSILGMPADSDWALISPFVDKALIRNTFVYSLGRELGIAAPRTAFVELYVNNEDHPVHSGDYLGVYVLVETIKISKHRLDLDKLTSTDVTAPTITGGYVFKFEWKEAEEPIIHCPASAANCWDALELAEPKSAAAQQADYITSYIQSFNDAIHSAQFTDLTTGYPAFTARDSFVDVVIINEMTRTLDAYVRSADFYKGRGGKIFAGPLWDYDIAMGVGGEFDNLNAAGFQYEENVTRRTSDWFQRMMKDPAFQAAVVSRWRSLRLGILSDRSLDDRIDTLSQLVAPAASRNFVRWPNLQSEYVFGTTVQTPTAATWTEQVEFMRSWLHNRTAWLDAQW